MDLTMTLEQKIFLDAVKHGVKRDLLVAENGGQPPIVEMLKGNFTQLNNEFVAKGNDGLPRLSQSYEPGSQMYMSVSEYIENLKRERAELFEDTPRNEPEKPLSEMADAEKARWIHEHGYEAYRERVQKERSDESNPVKWSNAQKAKYIRENSREAYMELMRKARRENGNG